MKKTKKNKVFPTVNNTSKEDLLEFFTKTKKIYVKNRSEDEERERYNAYMRAYKKAHPRKKKRYRVLDKRLNVRKNPSEHSNRKYRRKKKTRE